VKDAPETAIKASATGSEMALTTTCPTTFTLWRSWRTIRPMSEFEALLRKVAEG
jgi:hypothetical protein